MALYKTYVTKPLELERDWWIVDAKGQTSGPSRLADCSHSAWQAQACVRP